MDHFAKMQHDLGMSVMDSALLAAKLRFRPILMTAFAFILGVVPLLRASGAGAEARKVMGMAVSPVGQKSEAYSAGGPWRNALRFSALRFGDRLRRD